MTIDEAIAREREMAEINRNNIVPKENYHNMPWIVKNNESIMRCAEEHEQLAEWLEDYKRIKMIIPIEQALKAEYNKAIDDFVKELQEKIEKDLANPDLALECKKCGIWKNYDIKEIAEQLKEGGSIGNL